ncbi:MAG: calcium-binding protein [Verrucomicrobiales bacterium]
MENALTQAVYAAGVNSTTVNLDTSNPQDVKLWISTADFLPPLMSPLDSGLGLPGLGFQTSGNLQTELTYRTDIAYGLDGQGFYIDTANNASRVEISFNVTTPGLDVSATLARLRFRMRDMAEGGRTSFGGNFGAALIDPGADNRLRADELGGDIINALLSGRAFINLRLDSDLGTAKLPAIGADFRIDWSFSNSPTIPGDANATLGFQPAVSFSRVSLDLGTFFTEFARPALDLVRDISAPIEPVLDALKNEIPLLQTLEQESGQDVPTSLLEYLQARGVISQEDVDRVNLLDALINLANSVPTDGGGAKIDLGDFDLGPGADPRTAAFRLAEVTERVWRTPATAILQSPLFREFMEDVDALPGRGMEFPIIENPRTAFGLLLGKDVEFFTYDAPDLRLEPPPEFNEFFRLAGPIGIRLKGLFDVVAKLDFGYDSRGLIDFATGGFTDASKVLHGFYVVDQEGPEALLDTSIEAFLAVNVVLAEAGAGGGLKGHAEAELEDPTPGDAKVRANEVLAGLTSGCLFMLSGNVTASLSAYVTVGWEPFSHTFTFDGPSSELVSLDGLSCEDDDGTTPPTLARRSGDDLALNVGSDAFLRAKAPATDVAENFRVAHGGIGPGTENVQVSAFGVGPQSYTASLGGRITANGGQFDDVLLLDANVIAPASLSGGLGNDHLGGGQNHDTLAGDAGADVLTGNGGNDQLNGGADFDLLDGGADNDILAGGDFADILIGGPGGDQLDGGTGNDSASYITSGAPILLDLASLAASTGDAAGDTFVSIERFFGSDFNDTMLGTGGRDYLAGDKGDDVLRGRGESDLLVGGAGGDTLDGGDGVDFASYLDAKAGVALSLLTGGTGGDAAGDSFVSVENVEGSDEFADTIEGDHFANWLRGHGGDNILRGLGGADTLDGAKGNDRLEGGDGDDLLRADIDGQATVVSSTGVQIVPGQPLGGNDTLLGGAGNDTLDAGEGNDSLDGGADNDQLLGGPGQDQLFGGTGTDTLDGGNENDTLDGGDDADAVNGGPGSDSATGGAGNDVVRGDADDDTVAGGFGSDRVEGGEGNDHLAVGDLRGPVQDPDRLDHLFGGTGFDSISADFSNQTVPILITAGPTQSLVFADGTEARDFETVHDLATGSASDVLRLDSAADDGFGNFLRTNGGADTVYSGLGNDDVDAGEGDDYVNGGQDAVTLFYNVFAVTGASNPGDKLEGGPGNDTVAFDQLRHTIAPEFGGITLGVIVDLASNDTGNAAEGIVISGFENVVGTDFGDQIKGDDGPNIINPLRGGGPESISVSGPDRVDGRGGEDTLVIDFSREDLPTSSGVFMHGAPASPRNPYGSYTRLTPDAAYRDDDTVAFENMEHAHITGASKGDDICGVNYNYSDTLIGLGGNDTLFGLGGSDTLIGGEGDDRLFGHDPNFTRGNPDPAPDTDGSDFFDAGPGNDYVEDITLLWAPSAQTEPPLAAGTHLRLEGGPGFDILSADFGNQSAPLVWNSQSAGDIVFPDGAYARNFEQLRYFRSGSGQDVITQRGRIDNFLFTGPGDGIVKPGLGRDQVNGGAGNDLIVLDYSEGDDPSYTGLLGYGGGGLSIRRDQPGPQLTIIDELFTYQIERMHLTATPRSDEVADLSGDDIIFGGDGNDTLHGVWGGNNRLYGEGGNDRLRGGPGNELLDGGAGSDNITGGLGTDVLDGGGAAGEIDRLEGEADADIFVLGDGAGRFYDDNSPTEPGHADYAHIVFFRPSENDRLRLHGPQSEYHLANSPLADVSGMALYHDSNGNGALDSATDELIAILYSDQTLTAANTIATAAAPQSASLSLAGIDSLDVVFGADGIPTIAFSTFQSLPIGVLVEIQASIDLGATNPWRTVASRLGNGAWNGSATVEVGTIAQGKVPVTARAPQPVASRRSEFFRVVVAVL